MFKKNFQKKNKNKDETLELNLVVGEPLEAKWNQVKLTAQQEIARLENSWKEIPDAILINKEILKLCEQKLKEFNNPKTSKCFR